MRNTFYNGKLKAVEARTEHQAEAAAGAAVVLLLVECDAGDHAVAPGQVCMNMQTARGTVAPRCRIQLQL